MKSNSNVFEVEVLVHGRPIQEYLYEGSVFVEGREKSNFTLRLHNHSSRRVSAVIGVDGRSAMTGKPASATDAGYIVNPYSSVDVPGWRINDQDVASFVFSAPNESYASQMGDSDNLGVIGVQFFFEAKRLYTPPPTYRHDDFLGGGMRSKSFGSPMRSANLGTGFGQRQEHQVTSVSFQREMTAAAVIAIRYDSRAGLERRGIQIVSAHKSKDAVLEANPFPGDSGCTPPPGWRG